MATPDLRHRVDRGAVAAEPAAPGEPGHAEELDELVDLVEELHADDATQNHTAPDGAPAWRQGYPYDTKMDRREDERTQRRLPIELPQLPALLQDTGQKVAVPFAGRDAPRQGGA